MPKPYKMTQPAKLEARIRRAGGRTLKAPFALRLGGRPIVDAAGRGCDVLTVWGAFFRGRASLLAHVATCSEADFEELRITAIGQLQPARKPRKFR